MKYPSDKPRRNIATIVAHTIFIVMLFVLPELVMAIASPHRSTWDFYPGFYFKMLVFLGVFYLNCFYLVDKYLGQQKPRIWVFIGFNALVVIVALAINYGVSALLLDHPHPRRWEHLTYAQRIAGTVSFMLRDAVMMILAIGLAAAMRLSTRWADIQLQRQKLLSAQRQSELDSLKSQLNPHFLFNTLNTIYALIDINSEDAKEAVHKLSGMLRYMLYEDLPAVPLKREADFIANYVSLMRLRLRVSDHPLEVVVESSDAAKNISVPPLIFIPLIENALKYGVDAPAGVPVTITLAIEDDRIVCRTLNGYRHTSSKEKGRGGIGLANLRRRLVLIYGSAASLRTSCSDGMYSAELSLPLEIPSVPPRSSERQ